MKEAGILDTEKYEQVLQVSVGYDIVRKGRNI
jgi:hypothetical protein